MRTPNSLNPDALEAMSDEILEHYAGSLAVQLTDLSLFKKAVDEEIARRNRQNQPQELAS